MNNIQKIFLIVFAISLVVFLIAANSNYEQWNMIFHYIVKNSLDFAPPIKTPNFPVIISCAVSVGSLIGFFLFKDK